MEKRLTEMVTDCIELISKKRKENLSSEEYYVGLMELHKKYPMAGHEPALTPFQFKHYLTMTMFVKDRDTKVVYETHIVPFNFQEAAEMYIRNAQRLAEDFPPVSAWKKRGFFFGSEWHPEKIKEPKLLGEEAEHFELKRSEVKYKILQYKDEDD